MSYFFLALDSSPKKNLGHFKKKNSVQKSRFFPMFSLLKKKSQKKNIFFDPFKLLNKKLDLTFPLFLPLKISIFFLAEFFFDHQKPGFPYILPFKKFCPKFFSLDFCWFNLKSAHRTPFTRQNVVIQKSKYFTPIFGVKSSISLYHHNRGGQKCFVSHPLQRVF